MPTGDNNNQSGQSKPEVPVTKVWNGNELFLSSTRSRIGSLEELIASTGVDTEEWSVKSFEATAHETGAMPKAVRPTNDDFWTRQDTNPIVIPLYNIKAKFQRKVLQITVREELNAMVALAKKEAFHKRPAKRRPPKAVSNNLLEISIPDLHIGKYAQADECGVSYDIKAACAEHAKAIESIIERVEAYKVDKILFVLGNDFVNTDNSNDTTYSGTPQSVDGRWHSAFRAAWQVAVASIERLREIAPVDVLDVPGNHDKDTAFAIGEVVGAWFHHCPDVTVDNSPSPRKYYEFGEVMLCFTHGDKEKPADLPLLIAHERKEMWGRTSYHEVHTGHLHKSKVTLDEYHGTRVRILPSLSAAEDWHHENGYVGNIRSAEAFIWNKSHGLVGTAIYNVKI